MLLRWLKFLSRRARTVGHQVSASLETNNISARGDIQASSNLLRYFQAAPGDHFKNGRYVTIKGLGQGRYSHVWLAKDLQTESYVALKILTADCYGQKHDVYEIELLQDIAKHQAKVHNSHIINMLDTFQHKGPDSTHECIVTPVLGTDLHSYARRFPNNRIPVRSMKRITRQILQGLDFLHTQCEIIHTDLKASNILFGLENAQETIEAALKGDSGDIIHLDTPLDTEMKDMQLRIIDLGVSCWVHKRLSDLIQPEHLRAPEVILRAPWSTPVDIWSLGCVIIELIKGHIAFPGSAHPKGKWTSEDDHLAQYMEVLGPMPHGLLLRGHRTAEFFDDKNNLLRIPDLKWTSLEAHMDGEQYPFQRPDDMSKEDALLFVDFLRGALCLDPEHRKTAAELLKHPWLSS